ncbi:MAG: hypothetical protein WB797_16735 [Nocardioides sp.]
MVTNGGIVFFDQSDNGRDGRLVDTRRPMRARVLVVLVAAVVAFSGSAAGAHAQAPKVTKHQYAAVHDGMTRHRVQHHVLGMKGEHLARYVDRRHGHHAVRRYPTVRPHTWVVIDYLVAHDHLRVFFKTHCTWSVDGVDCHPGATS